MNSKNHFLRSLGLAFRVVFIFLFAISVFSAAPIHAAGEPDLAISMIHNGGNFIPLENGRTYTITVENVGESQTTGTVTMVVTLPAGLTATAISGNPDWNCALGTLTCTNSVPLPNGESYDNITLTVNVLVGATNPQTIEAVVSGGGEVDPTLSNVLYDTPIDAKADLIITGYQLLNADKSAVITQPNPNEAFWVRMTIQNQGGANTADFYPGVFLDNKPNYGADHDMTGISIPPGYPVTLTLGETTDFQGYKVTGPTAQDDAGCLYYDPNNLIDPTNTEVIFERGNYHPNDFLPGLPAGTTSTYDVEIVYPEADYQDSIYDNIRTGLPLGSYTFYLYADTGCNVDDEVSETNNSYTNPVTFTTTGGFASGPTNVDVTIGGTSRGTYAMDPGESLPLKYPVTGGPVVISSDNGVGIIASLNQWRRLGDGSPWTGVAQSMAIPVESITNTYVMPRYVGNDPTLYNAILMANVDTVSRDITVTIGGTLRGTYTLAPSASQFVVYDGVVGGPIVVSSDTGAQIVASLYELKRGAANTTYNGQSEMNGLPLNQLSDTYLIPIYFGNPVHIGLDARLFIANADTVSRDITVTIGGVTMGTYTLPPNTSQVLKYPITGGPVEVSGPPGSKIIASLNQWRRLGAGSPWTGVAQSMAIPVESITDTYVLPRYVGNDPTLYNAILIANVDTVSRDITVTIAGTLRGTYTLAPSASQFVVYDGVVGGPIVVSSDTGAQIVTSLYELKRGAANTTYNGQSEMNGLPLNQLSDTYLIPIYFGNPVHIGLDARLFIAVP